MKRVLVIAYYWPPSGGSGVQRWVKFCKYLPQEGWQPVVFAPENADYPSLDPSLEADLPKDLEVLRGRIWEPYAAYRKLLGGKNASTQVTEISSGKKTWKQRLSLWIRANLFVPDPRVGWVKPSVKTLKAYLTEHPVDVMVTTGPPHSVHLIGLQLHKALGTPWIPDFRDPWSRMYYLKYLPMTEKTWNKLRRQEQTVLDSCSTVLACTPLVQEEFQAQTHTPVACITNGFDEADFAERLLPRWDGHFNITHTGLFAADGNPLALWKVLGILAASEPGFREDLRIRLVGKVDREVLDAQYRPILPGKLFEYLAARRPILGIGQEDGAMARVLFSAKAGITADWEDTAPMRAFLANAWRQHCEGGVPATNGDISSYTRRNLTHALAQLLSQVSEPSVAG